MKTNNHTVFRDNVLSESFFVFVNVEITSSDNKMIKNLVKLILLKFTQTIELSNGVTTQNGYNQLIFEGVQ